MDEEQALLTNSGADLGKNAVLVDKAGAGGRERQGATENTEQKRGPGVHSVSISSTESD